MVSNAQIWNQSFSANRYNTPERNPTDRDDTFISGSGSNGVACQDSSAGSKVVGRDLYRLIALSPLAIEVAREMIKNSRRWLQNRMKERAGLRVLLHRQHDHVTPK
ncbi:hypothetical protein PTT_07848 [Pyrenophora teres f. teres 0-1]|uniref:Uncharacterized protein n=1 Tax=Pyrenophora teres f. teres (strain 0-1) TaxID=861557 RepID=E3RII2_PYRTT|nr:hypothetical protein PTT_07848 [Pyrenophora teres f. teres 0-1]